jgi:hypothetical protein
MDPAEAIGAARRRAPSSRASGMNAYSEAGEANGSVATPTGSGGAA